MKDLLAKLDLYKAIILICLLAMPVVGYFVWDLQKQIKDARSAVASATRLGTNTSPGDIEAVGMTMAQVNKLRGKPVENADTDHTVALQKQILTAIKNLKVDEFKLSKINEAMVTVDKTRQATNQAVTVEFKRTTGEPIPLEREQISKAIFNIESQLAWKLSALKIRNQQLKKLGAPPAAPPLETNDEWMVERLEISRKVPKQAK
jgi:hypothetical protein